MATEQDDVRTALQQERQQLLEQISDGLDRPMTVLAFVWLGLVIVELVGYRGALLDTLNYAIWGIFVVHFLFELVLAPRRGAYLQRNWLTAVALVVPALRLVRVARLATVFRAARATRGLRLLKIISTENRGIRALGKTLRRRGIRYVFASYVLVTLLGAAGMYTFENGGEEGGLTSYGEALWWTAMIMTTLGSEYWPKTAEGRLLAWLLSLYAFAVFGYTTAAIASFFVGRDAAARGTTAGAEPTTQSAALRAEVAALREQLAAAERLGTRSPPGRPSE
jgi:voltage-gated potassium channel